MESLGVLFTYPMDLYLEEELGRRFKLFRLWDSPPEKLKEFLRANSGEIRAVVGNSVVGADADMIDALPALEIVASFSVGLDKVDLGKCREKGIRVTNTPDVLTEDVADLAIGLAICTMRQICQSDRFVRSGAWLEKGPHRLTTKSYKDLLDDALMTADNNPYGRLGVPFLLTKYTGDHDGPI